MIYRKQNLSVLVTVLTVLVPSTLYLSGCGTTGSERADKTTSKMDVVDSDMRQAVLQIDSTEASLEDLIKPGLSDTKTAFKIYSDNVAKMERIGGKLLKYTDEMSARGQDYFDEWKKQGSTYSNPQIREASEQRRADLGNVFRKISEASIGVRGSFIAYMKDIKEIQTFLSTDLTDKGIESITPAAQKAIADGIGVKNSVGPILTAVDEARSQMVQGGAK